MGGTLCRVFTQSPVLQLSFETCRSQKEGAMVPREVKSAMAPKCSVIKNSIRLKKIRERQGKNSGSVFVYNIYRVMYISGKRLVGFW